MNVIVLSECDLKGSGYTAIMTRFATQLISDGHKVIYAGVGYQGHEHRFPYPIIPVDKNNFYNQCYAIVHNLHQHEDTVPDIILVGFDIPMQISMAARLREYENKIVGLFPMESGPLCMSWSAGLAGIKARMTMTEFAAEECRRSGLQANFFPVPLDTDAWRRTTEEDRKAVRGILNVDDDTKLVLTVAENQERKNLIAALEIIKRTSERIESDGKKLRYALVTTMKGDHGWPLQDVIMEMKLHRIVMPFNRGIPFMQLFSLYAAADAFLITSKAEGLGMPVLEAMSVGIPVVAPRHTSFQEHLGSNRGFLCEVKDPDASRGTFGAERRHFVDVNDATDKLLAALFTNTHLQVEASRKYVESRTWDKSMEVFYGLVA